MPKKEITMPKNNQLHAQNTNQNKKKASQHIHTSKIPTITHGTKEPNEIIKRRNGEMKKRVWLDGKSGFGSPSFADYFLPYLYSRTFIVSIA